METLRIRNIKAFADSSEIEIKPITIFVGRNSCGKSSLIRFPAVLAQTANTMTDSPIRFYGNMVDYGNYEDVKHCGSTEKMSFELKYNVNVGLSDAYIIGPSRIVRRRLMEMETNEEDYRDITLKVVVDRPKKRLIVDRIELWTGDMCLYQIIRWDKQYSFLANYAYRDKQYIYNPLRMDIHVSKIEFEKFIPLYEVDDAIHSIYTNYFGEGLSDDQLRRIARYAVGLPREIRRNRPNGDDQIIDIWEQFQYYAVLINEIYRLYEWEFRNIRYIGPFREDPSRIYRDPEYNSNGVGVRGENTSNVLIRAYRKKESTLIENISGWTKKVLGSGITLKEVTSGMFQIMLKDDRGFETNLIDNGYGISQVLPIVTEVIRLTTDKQPRRQPKKLIRSDRILLLEQPELHLHPAAQSELADLFVECALAGKGKNKILIETHSEHFIRKLQVLIASQDCSLTKEMVRIYYVDKDEDGNSYVEEMGILENGKFETQWPSGFFDKGYLLSRELARAGIRE